MELPPCACEQQALTSHPSGASLWSRAQAPRLAGWVVCGEWLLLPRPLGTVGAARTCCDSLPSGHVCPPCHSGHPCARHRPWASCCPGLVPCDETGATGPLLPWSGRAEPDESKNFLGSPIQQTSPSISLGQVAKLRRIDRYVRSRKIQSLWSE